MLDTPEAVFEALHENSRRPYDLHRTVTAEELVAAAEQFEQPDCLVTALLELMTAYEYTAEHRKSPVVFARLLKLWDEAPGAFSEAEARGLLWRFKWVTTSLLQVPDVPLPVIERWAGQMAERYRAAGHGMQPVAAMRHRIAAHTGIDEEHAFDLWTTRPREPLSDCEACEIRNQALHHVEAGEDLRALEIWQPVLSGTIGCSEEPYASQARALLPLLRLGRTDEARSLHLAGYRFARGKPGMAEEVGLHLEFCAHSRNEGRGLEILAENRALFDTSGAPLSLLGHLTGVQVLLARVVAAGHADAAVAGPLGRNWTAGELLAHVAAEADALTAAFDARNGTGAVGQRRRVRLERSPILDEPLPLGLRTAAAVPAAPVPMAAPAAEIPDGFAELLSAARRMSAEGHPGDGPLWERIAERAAAADHVHDPRLGSEVRLRGELAEQRAFAAADQERPATAQAAMAEAADFFTAAGMPRHALAARARAASWAGRTEGGETAPDAGAWSELDAVLDELRRLPDASAVRGPDGHPAAGADAADADADAGAEAARAVDNHLIVLQCRAFAAYRAVVAELPDVSAAARERFESEAAALLSEAERLSRPAHAALAHQYAADIAARGGSPAEAIDRLQTTLRLLDEAGRPWRSTRPRALLGQILLQQGKPQEARGELHRALADAVRFGDGSFPSGPAYAMLGHACAHTGDVSGAVRNLSEAAARLEREGAADGAAETRLTLADVLARAGQQADSVAVLESLLADGAATALDERLAAQIRLNLARGLKDLGEHLSCAEEFLRLADHVAHWPDQAVHTMVAAEAAVALARAGRWEAARSAYQRTVESHGKAANPGPVAAMMRDFARLTMAAEGPAGLAAALEHLDEADRLRASVPADDGQFPHWYEAGACHYERGRAFAAADRFTDALAELERAIGAYEEGGPDGESPRAEAVRVAALVEGNGLDSPQAAADRLAAAVGRCRSAGLPDAAELLAGLREEMASRREG